MNNFNISQKNWDKIIDYARIAYEKYKAEIGGMAMMVKDNEGDWSVQSPVILKQEISASNTSIDKDELAKYYTKTALYMSKNHPELDYRFLWWHSHHTMDAFWSGTDHKAIEEFDEGDMSFALVVNLKEEYKFRISIWKPLRVAQDVTLNIIGKQSKKLCDKMIKEVAELCEEEKHQTYLNNFKTRQTGYLWGDMEDEQEEKMDTLSYEASYDPVLQNVVHTIDEITDKFVDGQINYKDFSKTLRDFKKSLDKSGSQWTVDVPTKNQIFNEVIYGGPFDFIKLKGEK